MCAVTDQVDPKRALLVWSRCWPWLVIAVTLGSIVWLLYPLAQAAARPAPAVPSFTPEPPDLQEVLVLGPTVLTPGTQGTARVLVRDPRTGRAIPGAQVQAVLGPHSTSGAGEPLPGLTTDEWGAAELSFPVPEQAAGEWQLTVDVIGPVGTQRLQRSLTVHRDVRLELRAHKQVYHPGEIVYMWLLATDPIAGRPLPAEQVTLALSDPRGNRLCSKTTGTDIYGAVRTGCELADLSLPGTYLLSAVLGDAAVERPIVVSPAESSDFAVQIRPAGEVLISGQGLTATVEAHYPFGRPAAWARVQVTVWLDEAATWSTEGQTDESGRLAFVTGPWDGATEADSSGGEGETIPLYVEAVVTDPQGLVGRGGRWLMSAPQPLSIAAWPEAGVLKPGLENRVYLETAYPDGRPAPCELQIVLPGAAEPLIVQTDVQGRGSFTWVPEAGSWAIDVLARDADGAIAEAHFPFTVEQGQHHLLLHPKRLEYRSGELVSGDVLVSPSVTAVYVDLYAAGAHLAAVTAPVADGRAPFSFSLPADLAGALTLDAYTWLADGTLARDTRTLRVVSPHALRLDLETDRETYLHGETAILVVRASDERGRAVPAILDLSVVTDQGMDDPIRAAVPRENAADVAVPPLAPVWNPAPDLGPQTADVASRPRPVPAAVESAFQAYESAWAARHAAFTAAIRRILFAATVLPVLLWLAVSRLSGRLGRDLLAGLFVVPLALLGGALLAYLGIALWGPGAPLVLGLAWFGVLVALVVWSRVRRQRWGSLLAVWVGGGLALSIGLRYGLVRGAALAPWAALTGLAGLALALLALYAAGAAMLRRGEWGGGLAALAVLFLVGSMLAGGVLSEPGAHVPRQEPLPETMPPPIQPTPIPVRAQTPMLIAASAARGSAPVDGAGLNSWAGDGTTMAHLSEMETDEEGTFQLEIAVPPQGAQVAVRALTAAGVWQEDRADLVVQEPIAIQALLPAELTMGDRLDLPLTVQNATSISQTVWLTATEASWYRLWRWGGGVQQVIVPPHEARAVLLPVQVMEWGERALEITFAAEPGTERIQAGRRSFPVSLRPEGWWITDPYSWWVQNVTQRKFRVPWSAVPGTDQIAVKLYPGPWSVVAGALDTATQTEGQAFDQVTAALQARLLEVEYRRRTGGWTPTEQARLERLLALDVQRLLAFEHPAGGFAALPGGPPDLIRSAIALRCLSELEQIVPLDRGPLERTAAWLLGQQDEGVWRLESPPVSWAALPRPELAPTAYLAWALADAGYDVSEAMVYLARYYGEAGDPYVLALIAHALLSNPVPVEGLDAILAALDESAQTRGTLVFWSGRLQTLSGAVEGPPDADGAVTPSARIETTALAIWALCRAQAFPERTGQGIDLLIDSRDVYGTWNAPQPTLLALRALLSSLPQGPVSLEELPFSTTVTVTVAGQTVGPLDIHGDVGQVLVFDRLDKGYNDVEIEVAGDRLAYQIVDSYFLPWNQVPPSSSEEEELSVEVSYDRTQVTVGETLSVTVGVMLNRTGSAPLVFLQLGLPPGFDLAVEDFERFVAEGAIARYERVGERVLVYLQDLSSDRPVQFSYRLRARFPSTVMALPTYAVDPANPQRPAVREPAIIEVIQ